MERHCNNTVIFEDDITIIGDDNLIYGDNCKYKGKRNKIFGRNCIDLDQREEFQAIVPHKPRFLISAQLKPQIGEPIRSQYMVEEPDESGIQELSQDLVVDKKMTHNVSSFTYVGADINIGKRSKRFDVVIDNRKVNNVLQMLEQCGKMVLDSVTVIKQS